MTENDWLTTTHPAAMLYFIHEISSHRKLTLFCVACARRSWQSLPDEQFQQEVENAEIRAEGRGAGENWRYTIGYAMWASLAAENGVWLPGVPGDPTSEKYVDSDENPLRDWQVSLVRDLYGNPFRLRASNRHKLTWRPYSTFREIVKSIVGKQIRPDPLNAAWLTPTVISLAQAVYHDRQLPSGLFDNHRLAILADALEDAGFDNTDILDHLRGGGDHVRGCWALDLILGKS